MKDYLVIKPRNSFFLLISILSLVGNSCTEKREPMKRNFFLDTKAYYYNSSLDSLGILGVFGINEWDTLIGTTSYWKIRNDRPGMMFLQGYIRQENGLILLRPIFKIGDANNCKDQILFSFGADSLNKRTAVFYTCNTNAILGDSISLLARSYDVSIKDSVFIYSLKPFLISNKLNSVSAAAGETLLTLTRSKGLIRGTFTNGSDSIKIMFYPVFERTDNNTFRRKSI